MRIRRWVLSTIMVTAAGCMSAGAPARGRAESLERLVSSPSYVKRRKACEIIAEKRLKGTERTLEKLLIDKAPPVREEAARALAALGTREAVKLLSRYAANPDPDFRRRLARGIARAPSPPMGPVEILVKGEQDPEILQACAEAIGKGGGRAQLHILEGMLKHRNGTVRAAALKAVCALAARDPGCGLRDPELLKRLCADRSPTVRRILAEAVFRGAAALGLDKLFDMLNDPAEEVVEEAARLIMRLPAPRRAECLQRRTATATAGELLALARVLGGAPGRVRAAFVARMVEVSPDARIRAEILRHLKPLAPAEAEKLLKVKNVISTPSLGAAYLDALHSAASLPARLRMAVVERLWPMVELRPRLSELLRTLPCEFRNRFLNERLHGGTDAEVRKRILKTISVPECEGEIRFLMAEAVDPLSPSRKEAERLLEKAPADALAECMRRFASSMDYARNDPRPLLRLSLERTPSKAGELLGLMLSKAPLEVRMSLYEEAAAHPAPSLLPVLLEAADRAGEAEQEALVKALGKAGCPAWRLWWLSLGGWWWLIPMLAVMAVCAPLLWKYVKSLEEREVRTPGKPGGEEPPGEWKSMADVAAYVDSKLSSGASSPRLLYMKALLEIADGGYARALSLLSSLRGRFEDTSPTAHHVEYLIGVCELNRADGDVAAATRIFTSLLKRLRPAESDSILGSMSSYGSLTTRELATMLMEELPFRREISLEVIIGKASPLEETSHSSSPNRAGSDHDER